MLCGISVKLLQDQARRGLYAVQLASMVSLVDCMPAVLEVIAQGTVPS